jgi:hypothetical protein
MGTELSESGESTEKLVFAKAHATPNVRVEVISITFARPHVRNMSE